MIEYHFLQFNILDFNRFRRELIGGLLNNLLTGILFFRFGRNYRNNVCHSNCYCITSPGKCKVIILTHFFYTALSQLWQISLS